MTERPVVDLTQHDPMPSSPDRWLARFLPDAPAPDQLVFNHVTEGI